MSRTKKFVAFLVFAVMLSWPLVALASSYYSSFDFDTTLTGATRYYNGSSISITGTTYSVPGGSPGTISITLKRDNPWPTGDDTIGTVTFNRNGPNGPRTWSNVGAGNYYFYFSKSFDGVRVLCDSFHMYN